MILFYLDRNINAILAVTCINFFMTKEGRSLTVSSICQKKKQPLIKS